MKPTILILIIVLGTSCYQSKQKSINGFCHKMSETTKIGTKAIGTISACVVDNQKKSAQKTNLSTSANISLIELQDVFAW